MLKRTFSINKTRKDFAKVAPFYDFWGRLTEQKAIKEAINISQLKNKIKLLEVGVGTGQLFEQVLKINKDGFNTGIDLSTGMLHKAGDKFNGAYNNYGLCSGNAYELPFKSSSFEFIYCSYVLDLLPENDFEIVLGEINRVMKNDAVAVVLTMTMGNKWYNKIWYLLSKYFPSLLTNCRPVDISDSLLRTGFEIIDRKTVSQNTFPSDIIKFRKV
jgi:ubiquinone/menaquinone biosynthesis C-methylase UbiE